jgi:hypothetical protein
LTGNNTPEVVLRIRITSTPREDLFDEYDVHRFRIGETYAVPVRLASLLVLAGYAETAGGFAARAKAADFSGRQSRRR